MPIGSLLSHAKQLQVSWENWATIEGKKQRETGGWLYVGSHNLSTSAWGQQKHSGRGCDGSYECGVVIPSNYIKGRVEIEVGARGTHYSPQLMWRGASASNVLGRKSQ